MRNAFVAMAYDLPDLGASNIGPPAQYEGGLHPRNKWTLSRRLTFAALAIAYQNATVPYSGPVLSECVVDYAKNTLNLVFDAQLLSERGDEIVLKHANGVQIQTAASLNGWFDVAISSVDGNVVELDLTIILENKMLHGTKRRRKRSLEVGGVGEKEKEVFVGGAVTRITGVRYAWADMPCCPSALIDWPQRNYSFACEEAQCALYTKKADLPAIPFIYQLNKIGEVGHCLMPSR